MNLSHEEKSTKQFEPCNWNRDDRALGATQPNVSILRLREFRFLLTASSQSMFLNSPKPPGTCIQNAGYALAERGGAATTGGC